MAHHSGVSRRPIGNPSGPPLLRAGGLLPPLPDSPGRLGLSALYALAGPGAYDYGEMLFRHPMELFNDVPWFVITVGTVDRRQPRRRR